MKHIRTVEKTGLPGYSPYVQRNRFSDFVQHLVSGGVVGAHCPKGYKVISLVCLISHDILLCRKFYCFILKYAAGAVLVLSFANLEITLILPGENCVVVLIYPAFYRTMKT